jgi:hypothetical protein
MDKAQVVSGRQKGRQMLSPGQEKVRRKRNVMIALVVGCGALLIYAVTVFRFGSVMMNRPL